MKPTAAQIPTQVLPRYESYSKVPFYTPPMRTGVVHAPREAVHYGASSFNPRTGRCTWSGKSSPGNVSAYDPATGELMWRTPISGGPSAGTFSTGGNLVFAGDRQGTFYAFDAKTGKALWQFDTGGAIRGGQITYQVNGTQYIALSSGANLVIAFALPVVPR